ncbi:hypothetical protein BH09MYX1_BH09MYX1_29590 [soil metagenome]
MHGARGQAAWGRPLLRSVVVCLLLVAACGSRSALDNPVGEPRLDLRCTSAEGVRLCGGACTEPFACPGRGCTPPLAFDGSPATVGVCWADAPSVIRPCNLCHDGEGCLERESGEHYCVPIDVCLALASAGERDVCRYPDLTPYVPRLGPSDAATCPDQPNDGAFLCGGRCSACAGDTCRGRSPSHPLGICGRSPEPNAACGEPFCKGGSYLCGVFEGGDPVLARKYGHCMFPKECIASAKLIKGFHCELADGSRVP